MEENNMKKEEELKENETNQDKEKTGSSLLKAIIITSIIFGVLSIIGFGMLN